jgi:two-component system NarL family response regulator
VSEGFPLKIILADDHPLLLEGLKAYLNEVEDIQVVGTVRNGLELLSTLKEIKTNLILLDLQMPRMDGLEVLKLIQKEYPLIKTIIFTNYKSPKLAKEVKLLGAKGLLIKDSPSYLLKKSILAVARGELWFEDLDIPMEPLKPQFSDEFIKKYDLSPREIEIISYIALEHTTNQIAQALFLSPYTVSAHRRNICKKLNIHTPIGLINFAKQNQMG